MQKKKLVLLALEITLAAILIPVVYWVAAKLLIEPIERHVFEEVPTGLVFLMVIGFDVGWVIAMKVWKLKRIDIKIILTLLVLTLSASALTCLVALGAMAGAFM
ncbi:MAG: hypothetical protein ACYSTF_04290 [Planctomycetota bacterium]|jgi:hypothetical protein